MAKSGTLTVKMCAVDDCAKPVTGRGWCSMHYTRWRKWGDVHAERMRGNFGALPQTPPGSGVQCPCCEHWYATNSKLTIHCRRLHAPLLPVKCSIDRST